MSDPQGREICAWFTIIWITVLTHQYFCVCDSPRSSIASVMTWWWNIWSAWTSDSNISQMSSKYRGGLLADSLSLFSLSLSSLSISLPFPFVSLLTSKFLPGKGRAENKHVNKSFSLFHPECLDVVDHPCPSCLWFSVVLSASFPLLFSPELWAIHSK